MEQVAQGGCGCPIPGGIQGQAGCGSGQPGLVVGDPAHSRDLKLHDLWAPFQPKPFYDSMVLWNLLKTFCLLCFSKLVSLLMIEMRLDAFDVVSLMGVSTWEVSKGTFLCCFIMTWWKPCHSNKIHQVCPELSPLAGCCIPAWAARSCRAAAASCTTMH